MSRKLFNLPLQELFYSANKPHVVFMRVSHLQVLPVLSGKTLLNRGQGKSLRLQHGILYKTRMAY